MGLPCGGKVERGPAPLSEPAETAQSPAVKKEEIRLDETNLFFLACREAFRDGPVTPAENSLLQALQGYLEMNPEHAKRIALAAMRDLKRRPRKPKGPLTTEKLYGTAVKLAWKKGICTPQEQELLDGIADLYKIEQGLALAIQEHVLGDEAASTIITKSTILPPKAGVDQREALKQALLAAGAQSASGDALGATVADLNYTDTGEPEELTPSEEDIGGAGEGLQKMFSAPIPPPVETWNQRKKRSMAFKADELDFDEDFAWDCTYKGDSWKGGVVVGAGALWTLVMLLDRGRALLYFPVAAVFLALGGQMLRKGKLPKLGERPRNPWKAAAGSAVLAGPLFLFFLLASTQTTYDPGIEWRATMDRSRSAAESGSWKVAQEEGKKALSLAAQAPTDDGRAAAKGASWHNLGRALWGELRDAGEDGFDPVDRLNRLKEVREAFDAALDALEPVKKKQENLFSIVVRDYARFLEKIGHRDKAEEILARDPL